MSSRVIKSTSQGQITLPKSWREKFKTDNFILQIESNQIVIKPVRIEEMETEEEILFDAERDNKGKGASPDEIIRLLKKIQK
ncbi:MAG: AbrB/MazE/SpoVT family DNA-binding domain-containing protein [Patescibacteria group bacterium]